MTNSKEKTDELRKKLDEFAERVFPLLFSPELVKEAREFEQSLK